MPPPIELVDAKTAFRFQPWLENVYPFYLHDLSEFGLDAFYLDASGRWQPDHLRYWLDQPFCFPLIALDGEAPVGFAFVGQRPFPFMAPDRDLHLAEFFLLRAHRRTGLGRQIALQVLRRFQGRWGLSVLPRNRGAIAFWRSVLPLVASDSLQEDSHPEGLHFTFETRSKDSWRFTPPPESAVE
ncbi:MAG TPA: GNAT family N-acetyltransferase [Thermoanaerobaculia bacterium]|nr:GNAT family N-acetyltransferase [Thermoanaerobaculia bacterium]